MEEVIIDFSAKGAHIHPGSFYTALSRVKRGDSFYLRDFKPEYIKANPEVEVKMRNMEMFAPYSFKKVYLHQCIFDGPDEIKIGYININSLYSNSSDVIINGDRNLLCLDLLCVADTRLTELQDKKELKQRLSNWSVLVRFDANDGVKHMGLLLLLSRKSPHKDLLSQSTVRRGNARVDDITFLQMAKLQCLNMEIGFFYIRETPTKHQIEKYLEPFFINTDLLMADMNLDPRRQDDLSKLRSFCGLKRVRVLHENTTIRFNQLDHVFIRSDLKLSSFPTSFINHTSDHRTITIRIPLKQHRFSESFRRDWHFDQDHWTRKSRGPVSRDEDSPDIDFMSNSTIEDYIEVLREHCLASTLIFDTTFVESCLHGQGLPPKYRDISIINAETVLIPFKTCVNSIQTNFLLKWSRSAESDQERNLLIFSPTPLPSDEELQDFQFFGNFITKYAKDLYGSFKQETPATNTVEWVETEGIYEKRHHWILLLSILKSEVLGELFDEDQFDPEKMQRILERELRCKKVFFLEKAFKRTKDVPVEDDVDKQKPKFRKDTVEKRPLSPDTADIGSDKKRRKTKSSTLSTTIGVGKRQFLNRDGLTCWLNSAVQALLTVMDHAASLRNSGSYLYELLLHYQKNAVQDVTAIKEELFRMEKTRILRYNVIKNYRLFHFEKTSSTSRHQLEAEAQLFEATQQDSKDVFVSIEENKEELRELFSLFKYTPDVFTKCRECGYVSKSSNPQSRKCIMYLDVPEDRQLTMAQYVAKSLHQPVIRYGWKCEDNPRHSQLGGDNYQQLRDISEVQFLVFLIERLKHDQYGEEVYDDIDIEVGGNVEVHDSMGGSGILEPIAVIHWDGVVLPEGGTRGHYMADILDPQTRQWFYTSDYQRPQPVDQPSSKGYIFIYKRL